MVVVRTAARHANWTPVLVRNVADVTAFNLCLRWLFRIWEDLERESPRAALVIRNRLNANDRFSKHSLTLEVDDNIFKLFSRGRVCVARRGHKGTIAVLQAGNRYDGGIAI